MSDQLDHILDHYRHVWLGDQRPAASEVAAGFSGGRVWRLKARSNQWCLRRFPQQWTDRARLDWIAAVLRHVHDAGCRFTPVPVPTVEGASHVCEGGYLWQLEPWMEGRADFWQHPIPEKLRAAFRALGQWHQASAQTADIRTGPAPAIVQRRQHLADLQRIEAGRLRHAVNKSGDPLLKRLCDQVVFQAPHALDRLTPAMEAPRRLIPSIRDVWHDHILFACEEVTAIIDYSAMRVDTPLADVARLMGSLVEDDARRRREALDAYHGIVPLDDSEVEAVEALDIAGQVLAGASWLRWLAVEGRIFPNQGLVVERLERLVWRLARRNG